MSDSTLPYFIACITIILWGATPAATQIAVRGIDSATVGMLRTVIAAIILLPFAILLKLPRPKDKESWLALSVSSLAGFVGYTLLFTIGLKLTATTHAALILAAAPIFTGFIGFTIEQKWPKWIWWLGALIALAGEAILIGYRGGTAKGAASTEGDLIVFMSVLLASAGYVAGGRLASKIGTRAATAWGISLAGVILLPILLNRLDFSQVSVTSSNLSSWLAVLYLAIFTSILGYATWYWAIDKAGVARISPLQFTQPIVSLLLAGSVLGEPITLQIVLSLLPIIAGVILTARALKQ